MDTRSDFEKSRDEYFLSLEEIASEIDDVEDETTFVSELTPEDFDSCYEFVRKKLDELDDFILNDYTDDDRKELYHSLVETRSDLEDLSSDALLYENYVQEEDENEDDDYLWLDDDFDDDDDDDDDFDDDDTWLDDGDDGDDLL